jgi:hypothetical protein
VGERDEGGLELGRGEPHAALQHGLEEAAEEIRVGRPG